MHSSNFLREWTILKIKIQFIVILTIIFSFLFISCEEKEVSEAEKSYFSALRAVENNNSKEAVRLFKESSKSPVKIIKRKSLENLTILGNVQERNVACRNLISEFGTAGNEDYEAILTACRELEKNSEFSDVFLATENLDTKNLDVPNELIQIRLRCFLEKEDFQFKKAFEEYFLYRTIQLETIKKIVKNTRYDFSTIESIPNPILKFRLLCSEKRYSEAFAMFSEIVKYMEENNFYPLIISDLGKCALYGSGNFEGSAYKFENILKKMQDSQKGVLDPLCFYNAHFYAGRFYSKSGNFPRAKNSHFRKAIEIAGKENFDSQFDNAIWYLLNTTLTVSVDDAINFIEEFSKFWKNPSYFDDIFDSLLVILLTNQDFEKIPHIFLQTENFISKETLSKYAYISGRLIQEKLIAAPDSLKNPDDQIQRFFKMALYNGNKTYYKILAATRLKNVLSTEELEKELFSVTSKYEILRDSSESLELENLFSRYETLGFPSKIYGEWNNSNKFIRKNIAMKAAGFLENLSDDNILTKKYKIQGLRIASRVETGNFGTFSGKEIFTRDEMKLSYPQFYKNEIEKISEIYDRKPYEIFSLVRSESFFVETNKSHVGAIGLAQLMLPTAKDVAQKMRIEDSTDNWLPELKEVSKNDEEKFLEMISDPRINLTLGTFYLKELEKSFENQKILAFIAYNSGISNVRKWAKNIRKEYLKTNGPLYRTTGIAPDLFLEMLPFEESREYGRKIVNAAVFYGILYENSDCFQIVKEIFN